MASVELAIVLPILLIMIFGTMEVCQRIFVRQSLVVTAYEGARLAARRNSTTQDVVTRCTSMLAERRVSGGSVSVTPNDISAVPTGTEITVTVTSPWASNSTTRFVIQDQGSVSVNAVMLRE